MANHFPCNIRRIGFVLYCHGLQILLYVIHVFSFFSFLFFFRSCKLKINNASIHHSQSLNEKCSRKTGSSYQFTSCERNAMFFHDTLAGRPPKKKEGVLAMMKEPARKTSLEKKHLHNCGYFAIIPSCSHFTMLTKNPATGLV